MGAPSIPPPSLGGHQSPAFVHTSAGEASGLGPAATADLRWLYEILDDPMIDEADLGPRRACRYLARCSGDSLGLLIPLDSPRSAAAIFQRRNDGQSWSERAIGRAGEAGARCSLLGPVFESGLGNRLPAVPGTVITLPEPALLPYLRAQLDEPDLMAAVTVGPPRRNRKPVLQLLRSTGETIGFAKIGWSPLTRSLVDNEGAVLQHVSDHRLSGERTPLISIPSVLLDADWGPHRVVVTSPIGRPQAWGRPFRSSTMTHASITRAVANLTGVQTQTVGDAPQIKYLASQDPEMQYLAERLRALHGSTQVDVGLWHGDLTPWNVITTSSEAGIWDWEFAGTERPVGFDALHRHFEHHRRSSGGSNDLALQAVVTDAAAVVRPVGYPRNVAAIDAIVDWYLAELLAREIALTGQRWSGGAVGDLGDTLRPLLRDRLGP